MCCRDDGGLTSVGYCAGGGRCATFTPPDHTSLVPDSCPLSSVDGHAPTGGRGLVAMCPPSVVGPGGGGGAVGGGKTGGHWAGPGLSHRNVLVIAQQ